ncbi:hypothetical protein PV682_13055 [Streptomyces niveiscabiei]|uniref:hypothetical protein n=1 Tax=Streptomyces niveiscabiei TaxID=164115 RepID=UPI0029A6F131|nr:hypothetical protein [Streptomyces niveiscabiei]MDX3382383.1 hypothetical protein [Streptomyces niveiscabiei]
MRTERLSRLPLAALALSALLTACAGPGEPARPLTADEAQRLALARFTTYRTGTAAMDLRVAAPGGTTEVRAVVDHRAHRAVGWYDAGGAPRLLAWSADGLAVARRGTYGEPAAQPPTGGARREAASGDAPSREAALREAARLNTASWDRRPYGRAPLDIALQLALSLAADRPDNAQLLAQSGPLHLREDTIDGRAYDVLAGPRPRPAATGRPPTGRSPVTYWVDAEGAVRRVSARLGDARTVTLDLTGERVRGSVPRGPWGGK